MSEFTASLRRLNVGDDFLAYGEDNYAASKNSKRFTPNDVIFQLFNQKYPENSKNITIDDPEIADYIDAKWPTRIFIQGFNPDPNGRKQLVEAYFTKYRRKVNVIIVNWDKGANQINYIEAVSYVKMVALQVALILNSLLKTFSVAFWQLLVMIGHSLGAHVMGICEYMPSFYFFFFF